MIKLKDLNNELKERHLQWANQYILCKLKDKVKEKKIPKSYLDKFKDLIIGDNLNKLKNEFKDNKDNELDKELKNIFNYGNFSSGDKKWGRNRLISELNVKTCPYCNRQYITNYTFEDKDRVTADLDHFYSQSKYPYLALNIYNFIPSCQICNRTMKGPKEMEEGIYPYEDEFGENGKFKIKSENIIPIGKNDLEIGIEVYGNNERIDRSIEVFKLREVYKNSHNDYVLNMLEYFQKYNERYSDDINDLFLEDFEVDLKEEFIELIKQPYKFKIENNEPLSKLTKDILEDYGIYI